MYIKNRSATSNQWQYDTCKINPTWSVFSTIPVPYCMKRGYASLRSVVYQVEPFVSQNRTHSFFDTPGFHDLSQTSPLRAATYWNANISSRGSSPWSCRYFSFMLRRRIHIPYIHEEGTYLSCFARQSSILYAPRDRPLSLTFCELDPFMS